MIQHTANSSYREKLIEHLFVGELLKLSWLHHGCSLEVAKPEVDNSGYDLIAETRGIVRHIQIKTSIIGGKTALQKVHTKLAEKPSGCVVWIYFDEKTMCLGPFLYFGAHAGKKMPSLIEYKIGKHTKGNKDGFKAERQNIRILPKGKFKRIPSIEGIYVQLFQVANESHELGPVSAFSSACALSSTGQSLLSSSRGNTPQEKTYSEFKQRDKMRELFRLHGGEEARVIQAYAEIEQRGEAKRKNDKHSLTAYQYASRLFADGICKGWIRQ